MRGRVDSVSEIPRTHPAPSPHAPPLQDFVPSVLHGPATTASSGAGPRRGRGSSHPQPSAAGPGASTIGYVPPTVLYEGPRLSKGAAAGHGAAASATPSTSTSDKRSTSDRRSASANNDQLGPGATRKSRPPSEEDGVARYKTELCRGFMETGECKYGPKCQFAHGKDDLRALTRHPKYKTEVCKSYHSIGSCSYGPRCRFIHELGEAVTVGSLAVAAAGVVVCDDVVVLPPVPVPRRSSERAEKVGDSVIPGTVERPSGSSSILTTAALPDHTTTPPRAAFDEPTQEAEESPQRGHRRHSSGSRLSVFREIAFESSAD